MTHQLLDGYQWVLLLFGHSARHTAQILEVKASPGYPKAVAPGFNWFQ